jgi:hypothetical protein
MPARQNIIKSIALNTFLPEDLHTRASLVLFSETENRIPKGAWTAFISERVREYFSNERLDLAPYLGTSPGAFIVSGSPESIAKLKESLEC